MRVSKTYPAHAIARVCEHGENGPGWRGEHMDDKNTELPAGHKLVIATRAGVFMFLSSHTFCMFCNHHGRGHMARVQPT